MPKASWEGATLADTDSFGEVEGNVYFPPSSVDHAYLEASDHQTVCGWKGTASYYHVVVDGRRKENAAWFYPEPKEAAQQIKDHVAFWHGVKVG